MNADGIKPGDVLMHWHDTGCFGWKPYYAKVLKVTPKGLLRVQGEHGEKGLRRPDFFAEKVDPKTVAELRADGVTI